MRVSRSIAAATTSGPTVIGMRGPMRSARAPARADSRSIASVIGTVAAPACSGVYPSGPWSTRPRRKNTTPSAPYSSSVTVFVPLNVGDENSPSGTSGRLVRRSTSTNATRPTSAGAGERTTTPASARA